MSRSRHAGRGPASPWLYGTRDILAACRGIVIAGWLAIGDYIRSFGKVPTRSRPFSQLDDPLLPAVVEIPLFFWNQHHAKLPAFQELSAGWCWAFGQRAFSPTAPRQPCRHALTATVTVNGAPPRSR